LSIEFILFFIALATYLLSLASFIGSFILKNDKWSRAGIWLSVAAVIVNGASLVARWISSGYPPLTGIYETLSLFSFFMGIVFLLLLAGRRFKKEMLGIGIMPVIMIAMLVAFINYGGAGALPVSLRSFWLFIHVPIAIFSYAMFAIAAIGGVLYILKERAGENSKLSGLPGTDLLDNLSYRSIVGGFILLTMAIVTGAVWAESAWGSYWSWDPKETWSLITWFVYAIYLHARLVGGWKGKKSAVIAIVGFIAVIFTYFGVNLIGGLHSY
jgi:cytochrome c-type biogenesis protein CcsB